ncbi:MAG: hypothetical protein ACJ77A_16935 [Actinomycetota bacterium]
MIVDWTVNPSLLPVLIGMMVIGFLGSLFMVAVFGYGRGTNRGWGMVIWLTLGAGLLTVVSYLLYQAFHRVR